MRARRRRNSGESESFKVGDRVRVTRNASTSGLEGEGTVVELPRPRAPKYIIVQWAGGDRGFYLARELRKIRANSSRRRKKRNGRRHFGSVRAPARVVRDMEAAMAMHEAGWSDGLYRRVPRSMDPDYRGGYADGMRAREEGYGGRDRSEPESIGPIRASRGHSFRSYRNPRRRR